MNAAAVIAICMIIFVYAEAAIGTGCYMYLITKTSEADEKTKKQIKLYSIGAGVFFPITFALLIAGHAAERKRK